MLERLQNLAQSAADLVCDLKSYPPGADGMQPKIVAHRGAWDQHHIENTLKAFQRARGLGTWAIELDIHFTRDNVPVVHHDPTLERCHRHAGVLCDLSFRELRGAAPDVPTLEEVLTLHGLHFMLEVKTALTAEQIAILSRHLGRLQPMQDYHLLTLRPDLVRDSSVLPECAWILVGDINLKALAQASIERGLCGVAGHYLFMTDTLIARLRERGQKAGSGFLPTKNLFNREWARGVDWVFTNHLPALM